MVATTIVGDARDATSNKSVVFIAMSSCSTFISMRKRIIECRATEARGSSVCQSHFVVFKLPFGTVAMAPL